MCDAAIERDQDFAVAQRHEMGTIGTRRLCNSVWFWMEMSGRERTPDASGGEHSGHNTVGTVGTVGTVQLAQLAQHSGHNLVVIDLLWLLWLF